MSKAGEVLSVIGDAIAGIAPIVGGPVGAGISGAARVIRAAAAALIRGDDVEHVLTRLKAPAPVKKLWEEDTQPEKPSNRGKP
jgi:2-polyprenyl-6-methoxyphenol hydroxylase-like FAD-dependent oxidoreductase